MWTWLWFWFGGGGGGPPPAGILGVIHGNDAYWSHDTLVAAGMVPGDRYYVFHIADPLPEKHGRTAILQEVWQGGPVHAYIGAAYPNSSGPFYLLVTGYDISSSYFNYFESLLLDRNNRKNS